MGRRGGGCAALPAPHALVHSKTPDAAHRRSQARVAGLNVLVATPGRLLQHMDETPGFDPGTLQVLVLDEADRCLDMVRLGGRWSELWVGGCGWRAEAVVGACGQGAGGAEAAAPPSCCAVAVAVFSARVQHTRAHCVPMRRGLPPRWTPSWRRCRASARRCCSRRRRHAACATSRAWGCRCAGWVGGRAGRAWAWAWASVQACVRAARPFPSALLLSFSLSTHQLFPSQPNNRTPSTWQRTPRRRRPPRCGSSRLTWWWGWARRWMCCGRSCARTCASAPSSSSPPASRWVV